MSLIGLCLHMMKLARPFVLQNWVLYLLLTIPISCHQNETEPFQIQVLGDEHRWFVTYPGPDQLLGTQDDLHGMQDIHIPTNRQIVILLDSSDYIYTLKVPGLDLNQLLVPEIDFRLEFESQSAGQFEIDGGQMCGLPRFEQLDGKMIVQDWKAFKQHMAELRANPPNERPVNHTGT